MERERLTRLIQDAAAVERGDLADLDSLAQRFPWFAGAHVLRAAGVQKVGDVLAEEVLHAAATHLPSRSVLFDVVRKNTAPQDPERSVPATVPPPATPMAPLTGVHADASSSLVAEPADPGSMPAAEPATDAPTILPMEPVRTPEPSTEAIRAVEQAQATTEEQAVLEAMDQLVDAPEQATEKSDADPLERQILESALASAYDFTWTHDSPTRVPNPDPIPPPAVPITFPAKTPLVSNVPLERKPAITRHGKHSFLDWLEADHTDLVSEERPAPQPAPIPAAVADWVRTGPEEAEEILEETEGPPIHLRQKPPAKPLPEDPATTSELIDAFIKQQSPTAAVKAEFFTPQQAAKRSLDDKAGLVTETLARVYAKQGNLPKAVEAYKRLALKYPEKSAYFAALQKELEAQLNK